MALLRCVKCTCLIVAFAFACALLLFELNLKVCNCEISRLVCQHEIVVESLVVKLGIALIRESQFSCFAVMVFSRTLSK